MRCTAKCCEVDLGLLTFSCERKNLIIAVDGPQHIEEDCGRVSNAQQRSRDGRSDATALQQGQRVLRLHFVDVEMGDAHKYIKWAMKFSLHYATAHTHVMKLSVGSSFSSSMSKFSLRVMRLRMPGLCAHMQGIPR